MLGFVIQGYGQVSFATMSRLCVLSTSFLQVRQRLCCLRTVAVSYCHPGFMNHEIGD